MKTVFIFAVVIGSLLTFTSGQLADLLLTDLDTQNQMTSDFLEMYNPAPKNRFKRSNPNHLYSDALHTLLNTKTSVTHEEHRKAQSIVFNNTVCSVELQQCRQEIESLDPDYVLAFNADFKTLRSHPMYTLERAFKQQRRIFFNVTELETYDDWADLYKSHIRIYRSTDKAVLKYAYYTLSIQMHYMVEEKINGTSVFRPYMLDEIKVPADFTGWLQFDVTEAVRAWMLHKIPNQGLLIRARFTDSYPIRSTADGYDDITAKYAGIVNDQETPDLKDHQPFLTTFLKVKPVESLPLFNSALDASQQLDTPAKRRRVKRWPRAPPPVLTREQEQAIIPKGKECRLYEAVVELKKINLNRFIIAPLEIQLNFCKGYCTFTTTGMSTHGMFQENLRHAFGPEIPPVCCVPATLDPQYFMFLDENEVMVTVKMEMVTATSCRCN